MSKNKQRGRGPQDLKHALAEAIEEYIELECSFCHEMCGLEPGATCDCKGGCEKLNNRSPDWYKDCVENKPSAPLSTTHRFERRKPTMNHEETGNTNEQGTTATPNAETHQASMWDKVKAFCSNNRGKLCFVGGATLFGAAGYVAGTRAQMAEHEASGEQQIGSEMA